MKLHLYIFILFSGLSILTSPSFAMSETGDSIPETHRAEAQEAMEAYLITSGGGSLDDGVVDASAHLSDVASQTIYNYFKNYTGDTNEIRGVFKCQANGICQLELLGKSQ